MLSLSMAVVAFPSRNQDPPAQDPAKPAASAALTNKDVLDMMKAGLTADIIVAKIKSSETSFDTSPAALAELKAANVPDSVILAMVKRPAGFLGPVGLLWGLKKGKPAVIPAGNRYSVFVHGDTKIKGKPAEAASKEP